MSGIRLQICLSSSNIDYHASNKPHKCMIWRKYVAINAISPCQSERSLLCNLIAGVMDKIKSIEDRKLIFFMKMGVEETSIWFYAVLRWVFKRPYAK